MEGVQKKGDQFREGYIQLLRNELKTGNNWIGFNFTQKAVRAAYGAQLIVKQENRNQKKEKKQNLDQENQNQENSILKHLSYLRMATVNL